MELRRAFSLSKPLSWSRPSTRPPDLSVKPSLLRSLSLSGELSTDSMAPQRSGCLNLLVMLPEPLVPERELLPCDTVGLVSLLDLDIYTPLLTLCRKSSSPLWEPPDPVKATPTSPVPTPPEPPDPPDTTDVHRSPLAVTLRFSPPTSPPPLALPRRPSNLLLPSPSSTVISPTSAFSVGMASLRRRVVKPSHRLTTPLHLWMFPEASVTAPMSDGDSSAVTLITFHLLLSQGASC